MIETRLIPAGKTRVEFKVANSRFISSAAPAFSVEEAKAFIEDVKTEFSDATHNVPVFIIGHGASIIEHSSDDGEPSGTAGRPALSVLRGSGLGDVVVVVTRYFGGTKLGTGGLVRAYSDAVREVLKALPKARKVATLTAMLTTPYHFFEQTKRIIEKHRGIIVDEDFAVEVTLSVRFEEGDYEDFRQQIFDQSHGGIDPEVIERNPNAIMPV